MVGIRGAGCAFGLKLGRRSAEHHRDHMPDLVLSIRKEFTVEGNLDAVPFGIGNSIHV
jgi:hypothetical protein